ncbi:arginine N-methyltransferas-like protein [Viridothelium virens]|uniref:Protein arginine N-methyltransferase n=1 Tax=Viridothelium virens TaxID=1048519 RepID=A0A6A6HLZ6_VIRVR|nr:arginine N-methyltransferas-like protein [Viridothelium virens]
MDEQMPIFYVGQHETNRTLPVTEDVVLQAHSCNYDMVTTPVTTPSFHSRTLSILSNYNATTNSEEADCTPFPLIPPLTPLDTFLAPTEHVTQQPVVTAPWIDLASPDPLIANLSQQVFKLEVAYAAFCGATSVLIRGPRFRCGASHEPSVTHFAQAILEGLNIGPYLHLSILLPMVESKDEEEPEPVGSLATFAREDFLTGLPKRKSSSFDAHRSWDTWNVVRTICNYHGRLSLALSIPRHLPDVSVQSRWFAEPLRMLELTAESFAKNAKGYPVLTKLAQGFIGRCMRLRTSPWLLLTDVGSIPGLNNPEEIFPMSDGMLSPTKTEDMSRENSKSASPTSSDPTPAEAAAIPQPKKKNKDPTPHLSYIRFLQRNQPVKTTVERFGGGYQDYLQSPLQPLADDLESITYEVFEKDPVKYEWYERAIALALADWHPFGKPASSPDGSIIIAVVGAGRGPLVTRALRAAATTNVKVSVWAVEKNPNAYVLLQKHNLGMWGNAVQIVKSDMRSWQGPVLTDGQIGKVDILVSELLGSFGDNELSPECLDGVQHVLNPGTGISIPASYAAHLTPIASPRLHADIMGRAVSDKDAWEVPYVVFLHQMHYLSSLNPTLTDGHSSKMELPTPNVQQAWEFRHPQPNSTLIQSQMRKGGSVAGGGAGGFSGGDGANDHNARSTTLRFACQKRGICHGLGGYFETVLYKGQSTEKTDNESSKKVELSTNPVTMEEKSKEMISWFPIFFPLKDPLYIPDDSELDVSIWRLTDDRRVWYDWMVEAYVVVKDKRVRIGLSGLHSSRKNGCLM